MSKLAHIFYAYTLLMMMMMMMRRWIFFW